ncbi:MAG: hypothetical protein ACRDMX_09540, partial [Solirubrobacteraceae bacterium]
MLTTAESPAPSGHGARVGPVRAVYALAVAILLAGPTALAFFSGGYFETAQECAGLGAWALVVAGITMLRRPLSNGRAGRVAIAALAGLAAWTLCSLAWAPIVGSAYDAGQLAFLYLGGLIAAAALLRTRSSRRAVEPALAAGALIVIGYGLSERLVPGLLHFARSASAQGRLEQPLTYWNAMGELAALGFVLATRLAGDETRGRRLRVAAVAACAPLGLGVSLSVSRGALFACLAGVLVLIVVAPRRAQLRAALLAVGSGLVVSIVAAPFRGVTLLAGSPSTREREGAIVLAALVVVMVVAAAGAAALSARERGGTLRLPRRAPVIALALICAGFALAVALGAHESSGQPLSAGATRYETLQSNRYAYWGTALDAFASAPIEGVGAGGWAVWW